MIKGGTIYIQKALKQTSLLKGLLNIHQKTNSIFHYINDFIKLRLIVPSLITDHISMSDQFF